MSRDHRKLRVFVRADDLVLRVYHATRALPVEERNGLQAQVRRAAVSVAANIVEGCARRKDTEYGYFVNIALASAAEACYLITRVRRLGEHSERECRELEADYEILLKELNSLLSSIKGFE